MFSTQYFSKPLAFIVLVITLTFLMLIASCTDTTVVPEQVATKAATPIMLNVYKSPTCGCCKKWIDHIDDNGFQSKAHNQTDISIIKHQYGIAPRYRSCHTAISSQGYVFEGHVPAKFIHQFLQEQHADNVIGLSVPAMPLGSPGMEVGDKFHPYKVLLLKSDGSYDVYASIQSAQEQF